MAAHDLRTIGPSKVKEYDVAAAATAINPGEPTLLFGTYTSGAASANTAIVATDATPVIGTHNLGGIAAKAGTHTASAAGKVEIVRPFPNFTEIWGKAKTTTAVDTAAELLAILGDVVLFDLTTGTYTIDNAAAADTSGLRVEDGNTGRGELGVIVDARAMRNDVT